MSLQNFQYDIIMREYSRRQSQVQNELEEHRKEAFQKVPRLLEIDQTVASLSAEKIRTMLQIPETEIIVAVIAVGYGKDHPAKPKRKQPDDILKFY